MTTNTLIKALTGKGKGQIHTFVLDRMIDCKGGSGSVRKVTTLQGQIGVNYANKGAIKQAIEAGEREAPEMPSWAELETINDENGREFKIWKHRKNGTLYLPLNPTGNKSITQWESKGKIVSFEDIEDQLYAKDKPSGKKKDWMICKLENIQTIK